MKQSLLLVITINDLRGKIFLSCNVKNFNGNLVIFNCKREITFHVKKSGIKKLLFRRNILIYWSKYREILTNVNGGGSGSNC